MIGYNANTTKYFHIWASQIKQVVITSEPYIDELEQEAKLLAKFFLNTITMISAKRRVLVGEPRPKRRPWKNLIIEEVIPPVEEDIEKTGNKKLVEVAISLIKTSNKVYKLHSYDKDINNLIYGRHWYKAIENEL